MTLNTHQKQLPNFFGYNKNGFILIRRYFQLLHLNLKEYYQKEFIYIYPTMESVMILDIYVDITCSCEDNCTLLDPQISSLQE